MLHLILILSSTTGGLQNEIQGTKVTWNTSGESKFLTDIRVSEKYLGLITEGYNEQIKLFLFPSQ